MGRRIALVSYWAPPAGAVASHRILRLSRTLLRHGHTVHWITVDADAGSPDASMAAHTPAEIVRHELGGYCLLTQPKASNFFTKVLRTLAHKLPQYVATPDGLVEWQWRLKRRLSGIIREHQLDTLFMSCGPHGQITALPRIRKENPDLKILLDYRDLLTGNLWLPGSARVQARLAKRERAILGAVDQLFLNTEDAHKRFVELVKPPSTLPVTVMRNATDYELGDAIIAEGAAPELGDGIHLGYFGSIFERRRLRPVLEAINRLPEEMARRVRLHAFTNAWSQGILNEDRAAVGGVAAEAVVVHDPVPYGEALRAMRAMDALVLVNGPTDEDRIYVPGKLYDYIMARRPTLFVGQEGDAWRIVSDVSGEDWCSRHDQPDRLDATLQKLAGGRPEAPAPCATYEAEQTFEPLLALLR